MSRRSSRSRSQKRSSRLNRPTRLNGAPFGRRMWFEALEDRILLTSDLSTNLQSVIKAGAANAGSLVDAIHDNLFDRVLQNTQPLIGNALQVKDSAADKLNALSSNVQSLIGQLANQAEVASSDVTNALQNAVHAALGPAATITVTPTIGSSEVTFAMHIGGTIIDKDTSFDLGLPGIISVSSGQIHVGVNFTADVTLGFSTTIGVFLDTSAAQDATLQANVTAPNLNLTGRLGILRFTATQAAGAPTGASVRFNVGLTDGPGGDNRVPISQLGSLTASATITGDVTANLHLVTDLGTAKLPSISTDLLVNWSANASLNSGLSQWGSKPTVSFGDVSVDLGSFFDKVVKPVFQQINDVLAPVQPVLDLLSTEVPGVSELLGRPVTLADFIGMFTQTDFSIVDAVADYADLAAQVASIAATGSFDLGSFNLGSAADPRGLSSLTSISPNITANAATPPPELQSFTASTHASAFGGKFTFPIIETPSTAFDLLLGKDVSIFQLDLPELKAGFDVALPTIPILPPLGIRFAGRFDIGINLGFGYDTSGLRQWANTNFDTNQIDKVFDGFYLRDTLSGVDNPEVYVQARIEADAAVDVGIAGVGVGGFVTATVGLNFHDPNNDGRLHPSEIQQNINTLGPICSIFDHTGSIDAGLTAYAEIWTPIGHVQVSVDIMSVRLVDFDFPCIPGDPPTLGHLDPTTHDLHLYLGTESWKVSPYLTYDPNRSEKFIIRKLGVDQDTGYDIVQVEAYGIREIFTGVKSISGDAGGGDDIIQVSRGVKAFVNLEGGEGNDRLIGGSGGGVLDGGNGDDEIGGYGDTDDPSAGTYILTGDAGKDLIHGGAKLDLIEGGEGDDLIFGGGGDDDLDGGSGNDLIQGDDGNDTIHGKDGDDDLRGDDGNDTIYGDAGNDFLRGGEGNNTIHGNDGNDMIDAFSGVDHLYGDDGDDTIYAGAGNDAVEGNNGNDIIYGEDGDDNLQGQQGTDHIQGDGGSDTISGGTENDDIFGGDGTDFIHGDAGDDNVSGDAGNDDVFGDAGADILNGNADKDRIWGGTENDTIYGDADADTLYGEQGNDAILGGMGDDLLLGGIGNDTLSGEGGTDRVYGSDGDDTLYGYALVTTTDDNSTDYLYGEAGNDTAYGNGGDDVIDGAAGVDNLYGGAGNDSIIAGTGIGDHLFGEDGNDTLTGSDEGSDTDPNFFDGTYFGDWIDGGAGTDAIYGLGGADYIQAGDGNDWVDSGFGSDYVRGGMGDDYLYAGRGLGEHIDGEAGNDTIYGSDEGNDTLSGGAGMDQVYGQAGADTITGDDGDDHLDGGIGIDIIGGGLGNDTIYGGGGVGDQLSGDAGDDTLHGSDDGADIIFGGDGRDTVYGHGGNDAIFGGLGDDIIDGGAGDDTIAGDGGSDVLLGGANNDLIFGHNSSATGDDNSVDYIYGDFGTDRNEAGSGGDQLYGQRGNDLVWGEGGDDFIDVGGGTSNQFSYGSGEGANPSDFVTSSPTPPPTVQSAVGITQGAANLPTGVNTLGRWSELAGSGSRDGFGQSSATAIEPSLVVSSTGVTYAAWADSRHGNYEIYVAKYTPAVGWQEMPGGTGFSTKAGSASEGGVSNTAGSSRRPSIVLGSDGQPIVAWTEFTGSSSDICAAKFDPTANGGSGGWVALGTSLGASGLSGTGKADSPVLLNTTAGPTVVWLDSSSGSPQVYARQFGAGSWNALGGAAFASGTGISQAAGGAVDFSATTDGTKVAVTWSAAVGSDSHIFLREFSAGVWNQLSGSATGTGLSNLTGINRTPTVAYLGGNVYVAWQGDNQIRPEIFAKRFASGSWQSIGDAQFGVSATKGSAAQPHLASGGGQLSLVWADDATANRTGTNVGIFATRWNGTTFAAEFTQDAGTPGLAPTAVVESLGLTVDPNGKPYVSWSAPGQHASQVFALANTFVTSRVFNASSTTSVQSILDAQDLGPGDIIQLSAESLAGFTLGADDSGVTILGQPGTQITSPIFVLNVSDVTIQGVSSSSVVNITGGARNALVHSSVAGVTLAGTTDSQLIGNTIQGTVDVQATTRATIQRNSIASAGDGILLRNTTSSDITIRQNKIVAGAGGINITYTANGTIVDNDIDGTTNGIDIEAPFVGSIEFNDIHNAAIGVTYGAAASLSRNRIRNNSDGVHANVATTPDGFGFVAPPTGTLVPNEIYSNNIGVVLTGVMQWQHVHDNQIGVQGSGTLVASDFDHANVIESNGTGVDIAGSIQFNRIGMNTTGIATRSGQLIAHNQIYRNTTVGIQVMSDTDVRIVSNTLYTPTGDLIRVEGGSKEVQITDNIAWDDAGFDIYVSDNSQTGYWSDYNLLHTTGTGKLVHWSGYDFTDILDWQADLAKYDLHSRGRTVVNPTWSEPRFADMGLNNYGTTYLSGGLRLSNPVVDAGDPLTDLAISSAPANLLTNASFENGLTGWTANVGAGTPAPAAVFDGTQEFTAGAVVSGFVEQTVNLLSAGFAAADLDSRNLVATFGGRVRSTAEAIPDVGHITLKFYDGSNNLISQTTADASNTTDRWELVGERVQMPIGTRFITYRFDSVRSTGGSDDSFLDAAFLRISSDRVATDIGVGGNTYLETPTAAQYAALPPHIALRYPDLYVDWERTVPHAIRWETYGNTAHRDVRIDLYQDGPDGPTFVTTIAAATPDDGSFDWTPVNSGINYGTKGLRIQVELVGDTIAVDRSTEPFVIPENTTDFYVNDRDGSATAGNNRNTGKLANAPKPFANNILRTYSVQPTNTLHIDAGDYAMYSSLLIANITGVGDDEGFVMSGPTAAGQTALMHFANPAATVAPVIELNGADFLSIDHIATDGGTYGVLVHNASSNFVGNYLSTNHAANDGISIDSTVSGSRLDHIKSLANGRYGIVVTGPIDHVSDSEAGNNGSVGIQLSSSFSVPVTTRLEHNNVHDNRSDGISTNITSALVIGGTDLTLNRGNIVSNNAGYGIIVNNNPAALVVGNTVSGQHTSGKAGIYTPGLATSNVVFDNYVGIEGFGDRTYNRVYNNATLGLSLAGGTNSTGNIVYGNKTGIYLFNVGTLTNNIVYGNSEEGIVLRYGGTLVNNTVYQTSKGDVDAAAVNVGLGAANVILRNNILWATIGYDVLIPSNSQNGFQSDYNLLYATGTAKIGKWQDADRAALGDWQSATFADQNSLSQDPGFVNLTEFHEQSQFGSYHGGSLAPTLSGTTGLPQLAPGSLTVDPGQSPAIDRGNSTDSFANEPTPNGGFINLGAYGNTAQASLSPAQYVLVMNPDGSETWPAGQSFPIRWRSHDFTGNVKIDLLDSSGVVFTGITASTANSGSYTWSIPAAFTPGNYRIRVARLDAGSAVDVSNGLFSIPAPVHLYYVNDGTVSAGDWTTAVGNDANDGLSPAAPKASIQALLNAYDLGPGDTIRVDAGTYNLTTNILVVSDDSGVKIEGYHTGQLNSQSLTSADDHTLRAVLNRGNTAGGSYIFQLNGGDDVTISYLGMTGAEYAMVAGSTADSDRITISSNEIYSNLRGGISISGSNDQPVVSGNRIFDSIDGSTTGIAIANANGAVVDNNSVFNMFFGTGIDVRAVGSAPLASSVTNNNVYYTNTAIIAFGNNGNGIITVSGNDVHDTRSYGIQGNDQTQVVGNTVHDNPTGISSSIARNNTVYDNQYGIDIGLSSVALAQGNRVFNNSILGISASAGVVQSNTVYSNFVGLRVSGTSRTVNNVIHDNDNDGIWVWRDTTARIENNTIYQSGGGDAIQIGGPHSEENITTFPGSAIIQNNILHVDSGYAMNFAADSGIGSSIDYNDVDITGAGKLARWQNRDFTDLADWFYQLGFDQHSQTTAPQFLNPAGADGLLGFSTAPVGSPVIIDNGDPGYSSQGQWDTVAQSNGTGGDFLENSTGNPGNFPAATAKWQFTETKPYPPQANLVVDVPVKVSWFPHFELATATYSYVINTAFTVTFKDSQGHVFTQNFTPSFSGTIASVDQSQNSSILSTLHLTFPNVYTMTGYQSVTPISVSPTLTVSGGHNIIADRATMFGEIVGNEIINGQTVDDGDAAFSKNGFNWVQAGRDSDYQVRSTANPGGTATYEFTGLTPGFYDVSTFWTNLPDNAQIVEYTVFDGDHPTHWTLKNEFSSPTGFTDSNGVNWSRLGVIRTTGDRLVVKVAGDGKLQADAMRIQRLVGDTSADDDFHVAPTSPTIDAGNPTSSAANEPAPSGGRVNIGSTGNTSEAATSAAQLLQVLTPNGLEKTEQGQQLSIQWRTSGVPPIQIPNAPLLDSPLVFYKLDETSGAVASDSSANGRNGTYTGGVTLGGTGGLSDPSNRAATFDGVNDYISVPSPTVFATSQISIESWVKPDPTIATFATVAMKSTSTSWNDGYGMHWISGKLRFFINSYAGNYVEAAIPTGSWSFVTGTYDGTTIKLYVNGVLVASTNYNAPINHSAQPLQVGRGGGNDYYWKGGLDELGVYGTALTADQIKLHYLRTDPGNVSIQLVNAATSDVTTITSSTPNDGDYTWTLPAELAPGQYRIRITASLGIAPSDDSDAPFLVAASTHDYYVNDSSLVGDVFTTAIGNNANNGKSPNTPMASIQALLTAYDLDPGDVIHVDTGTYNLVSTIFIGPQDSGVRIEGPGAIGGAGVAALNRGSTVGGNYVIQLTGADNVTLDYLNITGGDFGIVAGNTADSDGLTISHSEIHDNARGGISLDSGNDGETIVYNLLYNLTYDGIYLGSVRGATVQHNVVHNVTSYGIRLSDGAAPSTIHSIISDNEVYADANGIFASGTAPIDVLRNLAHNNSNGIFVNESAYAANNTVYANSILGMSAFRGVIENNTVYGNGRGIDTSQGTVRYNRIFHNTGNGITGGATGSQIIGNTIYGQNLGILMAGADYAANNLIYDNANDGIWVWRDSGARIENNTIYQTSTGDAIQIAGTHPEQFVNVFPAYNVTIKNNILRVAQDYAINIAADSEIGFASDYNDFVITGTGKLARWEDKDFTTREDWFFQIGADQHSFLGDPQFVDIDGPDNKLGYDIASNTDYGQDDNFGVTDTSPTIDAGDPTFADAAEPGPNGNRINLGHTGNTAQATISFTQTLQVLSPNGLEKFEVGQPVSIQWQTSGISPQATANIEFSTNNGASWSTIAQNVAMDQFGRGSYSWTPITESAGNTALIRITANVSGAAHDVSDTPFLITSGGHDYYINDSASTNDLFTTALGNDLNSGKSPSQPMATLRGLLAAYDLDPGDVVHVDSGTYRIYRNVQLASQDSGVRIEGPGALPAGQLLQTTATFNRGNTNSNQYDFEFLGADDVTLDHLAATGAIYGVSASSTADSDRLTVSNSDFFNNIYAGIYIAVGNDDAHILNNTVRNQTVAFNATGIDVEAARGLIQGNDSFGNIVGIYASYNGTLADQIVLSGNKAHGNSSIGIWANNRVLVTNNTAYDQTASGAIGIQSASNSFDTPTIGNTVYNNNIGILAASANGVVETIQNNWAYKNIVGIRGNGVAQILGNHSYSNTTGISGVSYQGLVANNIVYANANYGIFIENSFIPGGKIINNTVYQIVGDAVRLENVSQGFSIRNNVLWNESGYDINVATNSSATNITSNYNLLHQSTDPNAHVGFWRGVIGDSITDWRTASGQDPNSVAADPLFVDRDGSDNVLGYRASDGYDGGRDDNFLLLAGSPAIDRADSSVSPATDQLGAARVDDPGTSNLGSPAGLPYVDLGAFEFQGSSLDVTPPQILSTTPSGVGTGATMTPFSQIALNLSEPVNSVDAGAAANYELRSGGVNHVVGDSDDVVMTITPTYTPGSSTIVLITSGTLSANNYRLTVYGSNGHALHDLAGIVIDGDNNTSAGGDYVRNFTIIPLQGDYNVDNTVNSQDYQVWRTNFGATSGPPLAADGSANGVVDAADYVLWRKRSVGPGAGSAVALATAAVSVPDKRDALATGANLVHEQLIDAPNTTNIIAPAAVTQDLSSSMASKRVVSPHFYFGRYLPAKDSPISPHRDASHRFVPPEYRFAAHEQALDDWLFPPATNGSTDTPAIGDIVTATLEIPDELVSDYGADASSESAIDSALDELLVDLI